MAIKIQKMKTGLASPTLMKYTHVPDITQQERHMRHTQVHTARAQNTRKYCLASRHLFSKNQLTPRIYSHQTNQTAFTTQDTLYNDIQQPS